MRASVSALQHKIFGIPFSLRLLVICGRSHLIEASAQFVLAASISANLEPFMPVPLDDNLYAGFLREARPVSLLLLQLLFQGPLSDNEILSQ